MYCNEEPRPLYFSLNIRPTENRGSVVGTTVGVGTSRISTSAVDGLPPLT